VFNIYTSGFEILDSTNSYGTENTNYDIQSILDPTNMKSTASNYILTNSINAIIPTTGNIYIGSSQTDGILNLGTGSSRTVTGKINIGNVYNASPIVIAGASIKLAVGNSFGTAGNVLTSGGAGASATWQPAQSSNTANGNIANGKIVNPIYSATTPTLYTFPSAFTGTIPTVVLTVDNNSSSSATIFVAGLASVSLTGFYYVLSSEVPTGATLNWLATQ
jgi:hypothetical protein